jgi:hypothetical protein
MSSSNPKKAKTTGARAPGAKAAKSKPGAAKRPVAVVTKAPVKKAVARKPVKPASPSSDSAHGVSAQMLAAAAAMETALTAGGLESLPNESLQKLIAAAVKIYAAKREAGENFMPVSAAGRVTPTDIMVTSSQLLRAGNLQVFELGMWQSWTGN